MSSNSSRWVDRSNLIGLWKYRIENVDHKCESPVPRVLEVAAENNWCKSYCTGDNVTDNLFINNSLLFGDGSRHYTYLKMVIDNN
jgi:hypothetical protein